MKMRGIDNLRNVSDEYIEAIRKAVCNYCEEDLDVLVRLVNKIREGKIRIVEFEEGGENEVH